MIQSKKELKEILDYVRKIYLNTYGESVYQKFLRVVKQTPEYFLGSMLKHSEKQDITIPLEIRI